MGRGDSGSVIVIENIERLIFIQTTTNPNSLKQTVHDSEPNPQKSLFGILSRVAEQWINPNHVEYNMNCTLIMAIGVNTIAIIFNILYFVSVITTGCSFPYWSQ